MPLPAGWPPGRRTVAAVRGPRAAAGWIAAHRDRTWLAQAYAAVVVLVGVGVLLLPPRVADQLVLDSSTNLANLREHPLPVLAASAFVVAPVWGLWIVPVLLVVYGAAQRWLGVAATVVAAVLGHVGATLFVAVLLAAGLTHGRLDPAVAHAQDVGVSYGLVAVAGLLIARVPAGRRRWHVSLLLAYCLAPAAVEPSFADIGHLTAAVIGLALALLVSRATTVPAA